MNSKDNNKKIVILQFSFIAALFIAYFVVNFVLELQFLDYIRLTYNHLQLVSMRPSFVKYNVMFTLEEIVNGAIQSEEGVPDMKEMFTNLIYENERDIFTSYKETYPSEFSDYLDLFKLINYDDICTYSKFGSSPTQSADCKNVSKGILEKGLRTSIVSLAESNLFSFSFFFSIFDV